MEKKKLYFITGNKGKFASAQRYLEELDVLLIQKDIDLIEPQVDTIREVAESKAKQAAQIIQGDAVFVMDSGLVVPGLDGFPGVYTKYVQQTIKSEGLLALVNERCPDNRYAYFEQTIAYLDEENRVEFFMGRYDGEIDKVCSPLKENPNMRAWSDFHRIFVPKSSNKPLIEMTQDELTQVNKQAASQPETWQQMKEFLQKTPTNA